MKRGCLGENTFLAYPLLGRRSTQRLENTEKFVKAALTEQARNDLLYQGLKEFLDGAAQKDLIHQVLKKWGVTARSHANQILVHLKFFHPTLWCISKITLRTLGVDVLCHHLVTKNYPQNGAGRQTAARRHRRRRRLPRESTHRMPAFYSSLMVISAVANQGALATTPLSRAKINVARVELDAHVFGA